MTVKNIERAIDTIVDPAIRELMQYRFLRGNSRASLIIHFREWGVVERTFDRMIAEGIESVANSLKYLE
ncbi:hypothetical protein D3C73_1003730 [compost metagenome]